MFVDSLIVFAQHKLNREKKDLMIFVVTLGLIYGNELWILSSLIFTYLKTVVKV